VLQVLCGQAAAAIETARLTQQARKAEIVNIIGDISHDIKNMLTPIQTGMWTLQPMMEQLFSDLDIVCEECQGRKAADDIGRVMSLIRDDYSWIFQGALESCEQVQARTKEIADCIKGELAPPFFDSCDLNETAQEIAARSTWWPKVPVCIWFWTWTKLCRASSSTASRCITRFIIWSTTRFPKRLQAARSRCARRRHSRAKSHS
jgi:hypothetical protein